MHLQRLQKLIAISGFCSRRQAEKLLIQGQVRVNGLLAHLGDRAISHVDTIEIDGKPIRLPDNHVTLLINKPTGVISSCQDPQGRPTILDLIPQSILQNRKLHPIGRLDSNSRGALILTTDGSLTMNLSHPRYSHDKAYKVWVEGRPSSSVIKIWQQGIFLDKKMTSRVELKILCKRVTSTLLEIVMKEGRKRQIRRTATFLGHPVIDLQRIGIASIRLGSLPEGRWRKLNSYELSASLFSYL
uniref:Pseudouridine synthase, Rsu n=1 Tax=Paulinella chromatophora TaxID=39717 RepID=B1X5I1_PAUCH|nr:Pseudouridine synthase, Rsu [Paulinella chromatophora]ACB43200.1 Pseudouridine synthase, Rsu [Paulinella chromatophora]